MRRFVIHFTAFLSLALIIQLIIGGSYHSAISKQSNSFRKDAQLKSKESKTEILFLGDSHVERAVDPRYIESAFNYSSSGENFYQTFAKIRRLEKTKIWDGINTVVFPFELHSFSSFLRTQIKDDAYWVNLIDYPDYAFESKAYGLLGKMMKGEFLPHLGGMEEAYFVLRKGHLKQDIHLGFLPSMSVLNAERASSDSSRIQFHFENRIVPDLMLVKYFSKCILHALRSDKNVVLVKYPVHQSYAKGAKGYLDKVQYQRFEDSLLSAFPQDVQFLDYQTFGKGKDSLFRDSDHLNAKGARLFSELLNTELRN